MNIDFEKSGGLIPAIIQDETTAKVLMLGYMNQEAYNKTAAENTVTFYSRTKNRLWTKGEESGNYLNVVSITNDCDNDTLLIKVNPVGPVCHTGADTCWGEENKATGYPFLQGLTEVIKQRKTASTDTSYTAQLFAKGINKIAQKVGEEAVEIVIEAKDNNDDLFLGEAADLLFHYMILLEAKGFSLQDVEELLKKRHTK
jgi:phosphoribosyl-AMP cyclohydrolase / phosphoribosyl-ATP pyrophosphohydrolase